MQIPNAQLANIFGILGNVVAVGVFLSPMPTFYRIFKRKSSQGYQSIPYIVALFSAMMLLYYGALQPNLTWIITINSFGCAIECFYLMIYVVYAPKETRIFTLKLLFLFNFGVWSIVTLLATFLAKGSKRINIVGWMNAVINISVFAAPLSVMRQVIETKSVEFMPISLSSTLTLNAIMWFLYGYFLQNYFIAGPNILGFFLGIAQMTLYIIICKSSSNKVQQYSTSQDMSTNSRLNHEDGNSNENQQIELKVVYNTEEVQAN